MYTSKRVLCHWSARPRRVQMGRCFGSWCISQQTGQVIVYDTSDFLLWGCSDRFWWNSIGIWARALPLLWLFYSYFPVRCMAHADIRLSFSLIAPVYKTAHLSWWVHRSAKTCLSYSSHTNKFHRNLSWFLYMYPQMSSIIHSSDTR